MPRRSCPPSTPAGLDTNPEGAHLAGALAPLSPDRLPRTLLTALTDGDAAMLDAQIQTLAGGSVITHAAARSALRMHRLVTRSSGTDTAPRPTTPP